MQCQNYPCFNLAAELTIDELARQHLDLPRPFAAVA